MSNNVQKPEKVLLIVRDGWGYSADTEHNMIAQADTPYTDMLEKNYPIGLLHASGPEVGLPESYFGNSEVGHMTMGAGRVLEQSLLRINHAIADGSFEGNDVLSKALEKAQQTGHTVHLVGLLQKEGVHASFDHLVAVLKMARDKGLASDQVMIHVITDGRDSAKQQAVCYIADLEREMAQIGIGAIRSLSGRYYAMDRNQNWDRTQSYYQILTGSDVGAARFSDPIELMQNHYNDTEFSDEFLEPSVHTDFTGIADGDAIIFFNFRKDRARQLTRVFADDNFSEFEITHNDLHFIAMTEYYSGLDNVVFPDISTDNMLGEILEQNKKTQLRISETEKYAHVTFFFDGGVDRDFEGETKIIIPSPDVATFDEKPEMASGEITKKLIHEMKHSYHDFILCNFPNADMVGHSGDHVATRAGVEAVDRAVSKIIPMAIEQGYVVIITADHGNAEHKNGAFETSHTDNMVPCSIVSDYPAYRQLMMEQGLGLKKYCSNGTFYFRYS